MAKKKYKLKKEEFLNWFLSDAEDLLWLGAKIKTLLFEGDLAIISIQTLLEEVETIPGWLVGQDLEEVDVQQIELID